MQTYNIVHICAYTHTCSRAHTHTHKERERERDTHTHIQVLWFWQIVRALSQDERSMVLQFVTGNERPPLTGFQALEYPFTVQVGVSLSLCLCVGVCVCV